MPACNALTIAGSIYPAQLLIRKSFTCTVLAFSIALLAGCQSVPCPPRSIPGSLSLQPPNPCRMDGCTLVPDFDFKDCCNSHDIAYWLGGTPERREHADKVFYRCIRDVKPSFIATLYYYGVRIGGTPYLPTPWRWGFGWEFGHGYKTPEQLTGRLPDTGHEGCNGRGDMIKQ